MLKIEKLDVINTLTDEEMREVGIASMNLTSSKPAGQDNNPPEEHAITADGTFKLFKAGTGVNAALSLSAVLAEMAGENHLSLDVSSPNVVTVELRHDLVREVVFPAAATDGGDSSVITDIAIDTAADVTAASNPKVTLILDGLTISDKDVENGKLKLTIAGGKNPVTAKLTAKNVLIAKGTASDPNMNHSFKFCPVGDVHIDACCRFLDGKDVKPNETSFTIRAENPFTKVITLG